MSKIGRNDPCPCGSGKKYKKCCIVKPLPEMGQKSFQQYLDSYWSYKEANEMSTEEIISKLHSMGIVFEEEIFLREVEEFYSAQQLSENWFKSFNVSALDRDEDFPFFSAWILWERLAPRNILSMEQMCDLIDEGYNYLAEKDLESACEVWLNVWDAIKFRIKPEFKDMGYLDRQYKGSFFISNFCQDLEMVLHNAGLRNQIYFEKAINYAKEFCSCFPNEKELIIHNMRRSIADSYIYLNKIDEAKREFTSLINDYPNNPWSYIAYGDMYQGGINMDKDLSTAKEFYEKALLFAEDKDDELAIAERLEDM